MKRSGWTSKICFEMIRLPLEDSQSNRPPARQQPPSQEARCSSSTSQQLSHQAHPFRLTRKPNKRERRLLQTRLLIPNLHRRKQPPRFHHRVMPTPNRCTTPPHHPRSSPRRSPHPHRPSTRKQAKSSRATYCRFSAPRLRPRNLHPELRPHWLRHQSRPKAKRRASAGYWMTTSSKYGRARRARRIQVCRCSSI